MFAVWPVYLGDKRKRAGWNYSWSRGTIIVPFHMDLLTSTPLCKRETRVKTSSLSGLGDTLRPSHTEHRPATQEEHNEGLTVSDDSDQWPNSIIHKVQIWVRFTFKCMSYMYLFRSTLQELKKETFWTSKRNWFWVTSQDKGETRGQADCHWFAWNSLSHLLI